MRKFDPPPRGNDPRYPKAREALLVLGAVAAEDADYAKTRNGRGFSKADSTKGHALAALSLVAVVRDPTTFTEVTSMAARYRRQASRIAQGALL
ncbi:hypothetical protein [Agrobacterium genomosp. 2]|uniref:Uncharacterized protein n=1 Tax=Agrobacterium genomosp. 2 str. CFBP 5494 TaxID=1183436 RepID=A0A9W5AYV1_9HYPH|nr:hypothetical protein [Agrobacterium genomosp. 2]CUW87553.1 hypothetical protein AGR2A_Cc120095 [Agrobacterium genomosp. 2 str. CFBP 5494]